jgi:hypothetical protein
MFIIRLFVHTLIHLPGKILGNDDSPLSAFTYESLDSTRLGHLLLVWKYWENRLVAVPSLSFLMLASTTSLFPLFYFHLPGLLFSIPFQPQKTFKKVSMTFVRTMGFLFVTVGDSSVFSICSTRACIFQAFWMRPILLLLINEHKII